MGLILIIGAGEYYEFLFYYPTAHDNLNIHVPVLFILAYIYGLIGAGIGSAIVLVTSGMAPFYVVYDAEPIPIARVVLDLQVTALANILGTMLLACVATRMRFVNRDLAKAVLRAEQEERQAQQLYLHAPVGLFMVDCDYRYVRINKLLADFNGVSVEEHIGRTLFEILPDPLAKQSAELIRSVFETGEPILNVEIHGNTLKTFEMARDWLVNFIPLKSEAGKVIGLIGVVLEITERKRIEMALHKSERRARFEEKRFRDIAESSVDLFWEMDENEHFTYCSSDTCIHSSQILGPTAKEVFAPTPEEFQINQAAWDERDQAVTARCPFRQIEFSMPGKGFEREIGKYSANPSPIYAKVSCSRKFRVNGYTHISLMGTLCLPASPSFPRP